MSSRLLQQAPERYDQIVDATDPRFVRGDWADRNAELAADLLPVPPRDFLRHPAIQNQMFVDERYLPHELSTVLDHLGGLELAVEDPVGDPPVLPAGDDGVVTSSNTIHHLHHLVRYEQATRRRITDIDTVVEWGGGYGNLAKLFWRWHGGHPSYVVIDTPIFSLVQHLYLSLVLGEEHVHLVAAGCTLQEGKVNVVPVGLAPGLEVTGELFVSTWAINESTPEAQDHVVSRGWFGAESLLVAMHRGDPFEQAVADAGTAAIPLGDFMPGQHYFVR